ncbi:MAG: hypothetical protein ABJA80_17930 [bacterium]
MRGRLWFRAISLLCGLWLLVGLTEAAALHACAMHDGRGGGHVHGVAMAAGHHTDAAPSSGRHETAICTCLGACCVAVVAAVPNVARIHLLVVFHERATALVSAATDFRTAAIAYARPPTVGPPHTTA